jgi:hypothetical protein
LFITTGRITIAIGIIGPITIGMIGTIMIGTTGTIETDEFFIYSGSKKNQNKNGGSRETLVLKQLRPGGPG